MYTVCQDFSYDGSQVTWLGPANNSPVCIWIGWSLRSMNNIPSQPIPYSYVTETNQAVFGYNPLHVGADLGAINIKVNFKMYGQGGTVVWYDVTSSGIFQ